MFIKVNKDNLVTEKHFMPFSEKYGLNKTEKELMEIGFIVNKEDIPNPDNIKGKTPVLYYTELDGFWYEYVDIPLTDGEKMDKLQNDIDYLILKQEGLI